MSRRKFGGGTDTGDILPSSKIAEKLQRDMQSVHMALSDCKAPILSRNRRKRKGTSPLVETIVSKEQSPDEKVIQRDTILELYKRVHILDEVSKEIFLLRVMGDLSFREIGNIFGKTENWARVTFYRAKQKVVKGWDD